MYVPKNKIITNLYTGGNEFQYKGNGEGYVGYYHKLYNGKFFTGKSPEDSPVYEIIESNQNDITSQPFDLTPVNKIALFLGDPDPPVSPQSVDSPSIWNQSDIITYLKINDQSTTDDQPKNVPSQYYPQPTEKDYNLGVFTRYFCVKNNENVYTEISKDTYDSLTSQKKDWAWELYFPFKVLWTLTGEEKEVEKANYNITLLFEQRLQRQQKKRGFKEFIRGNYLKFYKS